MKDFFEKLRDLLYDSIDYIIILAVIAGVAFIINWRLGGLFAEDNIKTSDPKENVADVDNDSDKANDTEINKDNEDDNTENDLETIIHVGIPSGSVLSQIAEILADNDLIQNEKEFIDKAIELNFDTKLKYGEFDIPKGSSLEEILNILVK